MGVTLTVAGSNNLLNDIYHIVLPSRNPGQRPTTVSDNLLDYPPQYAAPEGEKTPCFHTPPEGARTTCIQTPQEGVKTLCIHTPKVSLTSLPAYRSASPQLH